MRATVLSRKQQTRCRVHVVPRLLNLNDSYVQTLNQHYIHSSTKEDPDSTIEKKEHLLATYSGTSGYRCDLRLDARELGNTIVRSILKLGIRSSYTLVLDLNG